MQLKDKLKDDAGFAYVVDELEIMSSAGKQMLMSQEWQNNANALRKEWGNVAAMAKAMQAQENKKATLDLRHQMMELQDLKGTLRNLQAGMTIDEIELFQVKQFAFHTVKTRRAAEAMKINHILMLPDMAPTFELLDPDHSGVPTFYVYDSYEPALTPLRKELSTLQNALAKLETLGDMHLNDSQRNEMAALHDRISDLLTQQDNLQDEVLRRLSLRLHDDVDTLATAMTQMAYTDMLQAKAMQAIDWNLTQPELRDDNVSSFVQIVNPRLQRRNKEQHLRYQPVDIELRQGVCFITGANMAGKTVLLKTVGCAQMMAQFGMFVPAREASISLVDDVVFCIGDKQ
ncbi:MAG: hypothetical protein SPJ13_06005, partial [Bacteroidales bacterium]|nr:hypothetical protein [Bacteroidales bacterium]